MSSHRVIFKSTAIIGAAQVANIGIGMLRNKALAVLLAPAGFGLAGTYLTLTGFVGGITGLGLGMSGVRQIAEAAAGADQDKMARTVKCLRWTSILSGVIGLVVLLALSVPLSYSTFGNGNHAGAIALMSVSLLFSGISTGQWALLQGLRRLMDLAKAEVVGAFFGMVASVTLVFFLRERGIAIYLVANAGMTVLFSWWYARKVKLPRVKMSLREMWFESKSLMTLGFAFLLQNLVLGLCSYSSRIIIIAQLGLSAVGLYTAAWTLSNYYVSIILKAMGADFYPRLTAVANDHTAMNRLINEQIEMGLLIAIPGVLGVLALAPLVLRILYSGSFVEASEIIRWQVLGVLLQVVSWPIAMVQLAKGMGKLFVVTETIRDFMGLGFLYGAIRLWGLGGVGISVAAAALFMVFYFYLLGRKLSGFTFSRNCLQILVPSLLAVALEFIFANVLPAVGGMVVGVLFASASSVISLWALQRLLGINAWRLIRERLGYRFAGNQA